MNSSDLKKLKHKQNQWYLNPYGERAAKSITSVLSALSSSWTRRNSYVLVCNAGSGSFAYQLWRAGFDLVAQDDDKSLLENARKLMGERAEYMLAMPDDLPVEDNEFDYAVAVCAAEFWDDPQAVMAELHRVTVSGIAFVFFSTFSWNYLIYRLAPKRYRKKYGYGPKFCNPLWLHSLIREEFPGARISSFSQLLGPPSGWLKKSKLSKKINYYYLRLPFGSLGAISGVHVSLRPKSTGTPLVLHSRSSARESAAL